MSESTVWPKVTVVIPSWNTKQWLRGCLDGLRAQLYQYFRVILVDDGSTDGSVDFVRQHYPEVQILACSENRGFAPAVNCGIRQAHSEYVALLNVDTVPHPEWLSSLVRALEQAPPDVGCLASKMLNLESPAIIDDAGDILSWYGSARKRGLGESAEAYSRPEEVFSVCAGAALYRRAFLEDVGGFDESFTSYLEDLDLGLRGRLLGYRYLYIPTAEVLHQSHGAGLSRARYVYLMTRNRLTLLLKNIPLTLLIKHCWHLFYGQVYFFLVYKHPVHSLAGTIAFLMRLPRVLRQRQAIQAQKQVSDQELDSMLSDQLGEPTLREIVKARMGFSN
jgi:GT2 family glycosyltransferase